MTNIEFAYGVDANWDNTTLASRKRSIQAGLQFDFATPYKGFVNVGFYGYKEWQNDGFASTFPFQPIPNPSGNVDFNPTWAVEINLLSRSAPRLSSIKPSWLCMGRKVAARPVSRWARVSHERLNT
jgi:hypothetical protein